MKWLKKAVSVWTLNDENLIRKYLKMGVDSLVTDYPNLGLKLRDELSKRVNYFKANPFSIKDCRFVNISRLSN